MAMSNEELHQSLYDQAYELACQKANEAGDVDINYDYDIMEAWCEEYYIELCAEEGIKPNPKYI